MSFRSSGSRGRSLDPLPAPVLKYPQEIKQFGFNETKLSIFYFHGILKNNEIKRQSEPHPFIHMNPLSRNPGFAPASMLTDANSTKILCIDSKALQFVFRRYLNVSFSVVWSLTTKRGPVWGYFNVLP